jgi:hypothetical protein
MNNSTENFDGEAVSGAVVFIDLDAYLSKVGSLLPLEEWRFARPIYQLVEEIASKRNFRLVRTFGDAFLLSAERSPASELLTSCISLLAELRDRLRPQRMSFKAVIVGGDYARIIRRSADGYVEILLAGAAVNFAGKQLRALARNTVFCSWPITIDGVASGSTFSDIARDNLSRQSSRCDLDQVERIAIELRFPAPDQTLSLEESRSDRSSTLQFSTDAKTLVLEMIKLADDKAKAVFAVSTALLVYLLNGAGWPSPKTLPLLNDVLPLSRLSLLLLSLLCLVWSATYSLLVLIPRTATSRKGIVFFLSIAAWPSPSEYAQKILSLSERDLEYESAAHNHEISTVAATKFRALRLCLWWMTAGVASALGYLGISWAFGAG